MKTLKILVILLLFSLYLQAQPLKWNNSGISGGSALFYPSFSPFNSDVIYMASDLTGMFFTENGGENWDLVPFTELRATTLSKMYFTSHPDTLFTLNNDYRNVRQFVYRSDDGGKTWHPIGQDPTQGETLYLLVDPDRTQRLIISDYHKLYFSNDGGNSFKEAYQADDNIYLGGVYWENDSIYIGSNDGLLRSIDGGGTFSKMPVENLEQDMGILSLSGIKENGKLQFFCSIRNKNDMWSGMLPDDSDYYGNQKLICIEKKGENQFERQSINANLEEYQDFPFFVDSPKDNERRILYSAGAFIDNTGNHVHPQVFKLNPENSNWETTLKTNQNLNIATGYMGDQGDFNWAWSENAMGFGYDPNNPQVAIITDFSFAHITRDGGESWTAMYVKPEELNPAGKATPKGKTYQTNGLENTSVWWLTWTSPENLFASYTDITAVRSEDGGKSWSFDYQGLDGNIGENYNTIYQVTGPIEGKLYAAASTLHDIYQSTHLEDFRLDDEEAGGAVFLSENEGQTWSLIRDFQQPLVWTEIDPDNSNVMYVSVINSKNGGIYKTENLQAGNNANWVKLAAPPTTEGHPFNIRVIKGDTLVCTYSGRLIDGVRFTQSSGVFYSENGGQTWEDRSLPEMKYWTKDLVLDPHDESGSTWFAGVFDGYSEHPATLGTGGLYRTSDRGETWQEIGDFYRVESATIHPDKPDIMYVTTEQEGLWYTDNLRSEQPEFRLLEAYPFQQPVRVFFNPYNSDEVWVSSFGNGLRKGVVEISTQTEDKDLERLKMSVFPNPGKDFLQIQVHNVTGPLEVQIYNSLGEMVYSRQTLNAELSIDTGHLSSGLYFLQTISGIEKAVEKIVIIK